MNLERIIRVTSGYLFLTGYQIRWYDHKSLRYRVLLCAILYFITILLLYCICFCHHFENSSLLKMLCHISPFLNNLVRLQVILGLIVYILCIIETKNLTKISNKLVSIFSEEIKRQETFDIFEALIYLMFFVSLIVIMVFSLYIAIELEFKVPPLDHIMIGLALFMPHFTLAGCLRLYTLGLWLIKGELVAVQQILEKQEDVNMLQCSVVLEVSNPISSQVILYEFYEKILKRLDLIAEYLKYFDRILQRQLTVLVGMNFNCLLAGVYALLNFEKNWKVLFTNAIRRVFYASNSAIFVCISLDYILLLLTRWSFHRAKKNLQNVLEMRLFENKHSAAEIKTIFELMEYKFSKNLKLKLLGLVEFNAWNFLMLHGLMISIIILIVSHQYLHEQIKVLNDRLDARDSE